MMRRHLLPLMLLVGFLPLPANSQALPPISLAFLGIEGQADFREKISRKIEQNLAALPQVDLVEKEEVQSLRDAGILTDTVLSMKAASRIAAELKCETLLFGRIESMEIKPRRTGWFITGYYEAKMILGLWLYEAETGEYRYNDRIPLRVRHPKGYCGIFGFRKAMMLTADTRLEIQKAWIDLAVKESGERTRLNLTGLQAYGPSVRYGDDEDEEEIPDSSQAGGVTDTTAGAAEGKKGTTRGDEAGEGGAAGDKENQESAEETSESQPSE